MRQDTSHAAHVATKRVATTLWWIIGVSLFIHVFCLVAGRTFLNHVRWVHHPTHASLEICGALIAIAVAAVLISLERHSRGTSFNMWIATALIGMGLLDGWHALLHEGQLFVWFHSTATFVGGALFMLVWLPIHSGKELQERLPYLVGILSLLFGVISISFPDIIPAMTAPPSDGETHFTLWAKGLNVIGGALLFVAAARLYLTYRSKHNVDDLLFCLHCGLFGAAAIMFEQSKLWDVPWWGWHVLRFLAYGVALMFVIRTEQNTRRELTDQLRQANATLEQRVRERTSELEYEQDLLRSLVDSIPDPIFFKDVDGKFIRANEALAFEAGLASPDEILGKTDADIWPREHSNETLTDEQTMLRTGKPLINKEERLITKLGEERFVLVTKMPLERDGKIVGSFGIARDITERKHNEILLQESARALEKVNSELAASNEDLQRFAYVASHDLKEPLRAVSGFAELLSQDYSDKFDERGQGFLDFLVDGAQRMQKLVDHLLEYSRVGTEETEFELISSEEIVQDAIHNLSKTISDAKAEVNVGSLPVIPANRSQLTRVIQNLIGNAIKFCQETPKINVQCKEMDDTWQFCISDNGIGINPEYAHRIFVIFQRLHTRNEYAGSGMGLAICQRIIQRHGGEIWVESKEGEGSQFYFTIPKAT